MLSDTTTRLRLLFDAAVVALFLYIVLEARGFRELAAYFPVAVGSLGLVFSSAQLVADVRRALKDARAVAAGGERSQRSTSWDAAMSAEGLDARKTVRYLLWFAVFIVAVSLIGIYIAGSVFLGLFLLLESRTGWRFAVGAVIGTMLFMTFLVRVLDLTLPSGILL